ncbi:Uncharacterised protein [Klebsiella pneumoniae]|nr:Uncharacterised protein [Klebsiella pneumoniae]
MLFSLPTLQSFPAQGMRLLWSPRICSLLPLSGLMVHFLFLTLISPALTPCLVSLLRSHLLTLLSFCDRDICLRCCQLTDIFCLRWRWIPMFIYPSFLTRLGLLNRASSPAVVLSTQLFQEIDLLWRPGLLTETPRRGAGKFACRQSLSVRDTGMLMQAQICLLQTETDC